MMKGSQARTLSAEVRAKVGERVLIAGWVHRVRSFGGFAFLVLRDRSGTVQCVGEAETIEQLTNESVVRVIGSVVADARAPGGVEVHIEALQVLAIAATDLPYQVNVARHETLERQLDHRMLSLRRPGPQVVFRTQARLQALFREYLSERGFVEVHSPKLVAAGTEGGAELFAVQYFDRPAFLAQSPQLYKELLVGAGFERVFEVGPVFRAEPHNTSRHLNEYVSMDVEVGFVEEAEQLMEIEEGLLRWVVEGLRGDRALGSADLVARLPEVPARVPRVTFEEALKRVNAGGGEPVGDLNPEGERLLAEVVLQETGSPWVFVTRYPRNKRPFYALPTDDNPDITESFDLLLRGVEISTGGLRQHTYEGLAQSIRRRGGRVADYAFYVDNFRYGMPPHGGFALGLERLTMQLFDVPNVRQATLFPRGRWRLTP